MGAGKLGQSLAAMAVIGLAVTACTPEPAPTPTSTPSVSQPPTESAQERQQRIDYEAAEQAYRTFRAEYGRVMNSGGAAEATGVMKATAAGKYLSEFAKAAEASHGLGDHSSGEEKIVYVRGVGYSASSIALEVCEDSRAVKDFDKKGRQVGRGELRTAQLEVRKVDTSWKLWSGKGRKVSSCG